MLRRIPGRFRFPTSKAQWQSFVGTLIGDSGLGGTAGIVPAPAAGDATKFLRGDASWAAISGGGAGPSMPQGRLTLQSATPIMSSSQTAKTTIYYTEDVGRWVPVYDGSSWTMTEFTSELSNDTTASSTGKAGPAAVTTNSNYDLFVWSDSGTLRLTRGPAWTSDTARGTGAGTTELERVAGVYTNKQSITNGPAANRGTYVGTVRSDGSSQINYKFGSLASGGGSSIIGVWNMYNRRAVHTIVQESDNSWSYSTTTWRSANNSTNNRVSFVCGMSEDAVAAFYTGISYGAGTGGGGLAVGVDSTSAFTGTTASVASNGSAASNGTGIYVGLPGLGWHFLQALEIGLVGTNTFYGDNGGTVTQSGLAVVLRA